jgi:Pyridoxal-phosphate dependent enzyme
VARESGASRVVCASAGNLGQARAYSGARRGLAVTVVAARTANPLKLRQIAAVGADVRLEGEDIEDARLLAREIAQAGRAYLVEDALDLATCEGAASRNRPPGTRPSRRPGPRASCVRHARVDRSRPDRDWHCRPCGEIIEPLMVRATAS